MLFSRKTHSSNTAIISLTNYFMCSSNELSLISTPNVVLMSYNHIGRKGVREELAPHHLVPRSTRS